MTSGIKLGAIGTFDSAGAGDFFEAVPVRPAGKRAGGHQELAW